jgi:hypothetical protein
MAREFIERRETGFYVAGSRVPIDRVIWEYRNGEDPEAIQAHYPTLSGGGQWSYRVLPLPSRRSRTGDGRAQACRGFVHGV